MPVDLKAIPEKVRMGLAGVMLEHVDRNLRQNDQDLATYRGMLLRDEEGNSQPEPTGEERMMIFGDVNLNEPPPPAPHAPVPAPAAAPEKTSGVLPKIAAGAALLAAGGGLGALPFLASALNRPEVVQPDQQVIERERTNDFRVGPLDVIPPGE